MTLWSEWIGDCDFRFDLLEQLHMSFPSVKVCDLTRTSSEHIEGGRDCPNYHESPTNDHDGG